MNILVKNNEQIGIFHNYNSVYLHLQICIIENNYIRFTHYHNINFNKYEYTTSK